MGVAIVRLSELSLRRGLRALHSPSLRGFRVSLSPVSVYSFPFFVCFLSISRIFPAFYFILFYNRIILRLVLLDRAAFPPFNVSTKERYMCVTCVDPWHSKPIVSMLEVRRISGFRVYVLRYIVACRGFRWYTHIYVYTYIYSGNVFCLYIHIYIYWSYSFAEKSLRDVQVSQAICSW